MQRRGKGAEGTEGWKGRGGERGGEGTDLAGDMPCIALWRSLRCMTRRLRRLALRRLRRRCRRLLLLQDANVLGAHLSDLREQLRLARFVGARFGGEGEGVGGDEN